MSDYQKFIDWLEKTYPTHARAYRCDPVIQTAYFAGMAAADGANKRMFEAACVDLGRINECLGLDPDAGGAAPIIAAIKDQREIITRREAVIKILEKDLDLATETVHCVNGARTVMLNLMREALRVIETIAPEDEDEESELTRLKGHMGRLIEQSFTSLIDTHSQISERGVK